MRCASIVMFCQPHLKTLHLASVSPFTSRKHIIMMAAAGQKAIYPDPRFSQLCVLKLIDPIQHV
jgi:hypothetical protein